ncbi:MAG: class I SAM-dependent methyltransferase [Pseudomonadota bacterium]
MHPVSQIFDLIEGPIRFATVKWAFENGVFDLCEPAVSATEVAAGLKGDPGRVERVLQTLVAAGFLTVEDARFSVAAEFAPFVLSSSRRCFARTFLDLSDTRHDGIADIGALAQGRPCDVPKAHFDAAHWQRQGASLSAFHRAVGSEAMVEAVSSLPELSMASQVLDVGGGSLEFARALTAQHAALTVTLFDLPELARTLTPDPQERVQVVSGDYNDAATLPEGHFDVIWCSMSLYFAKELAAVLSALHERLTPGGALASFHEDLSPDRTAPPRHVIGRMMPALRGRDLSFADGAIASALAEAGLVEITSHPIETPFGPFRLDAGRRSERLNDFLPHFCFYCLSTVWPMRGSSPCPACRSGTVHRF